MSPARGDTGHDEEDLTSPLAFVDLMALERIEDSETSKSSSSEPEKVERFRSLATPFPPGEGNRSFGGHVFAQSAYAASKTVGKGFLVHVSPPPEYQYDESCKGTYLTIWYRI